MSIFDLVHEYADIGVHRTGTNTQAVTAQWLADQLRSRGGSVTLEPVAFDRYEAEWSVTIDGVDVEALPLFYEAVGTVTSSDPARWPAFSPTGTGPLGVTGSLGSVDARPGDLVVAATRNLLGLLAVSNRVPGPGSGVHVLQVAGHHGGALADAAAVRAHVDARIEAATCANVLATFGDVDAAEQLTVLTTPVSGWFRCAGERGTGIAVAIAMAERLAEDAPLVFLGATGHELGAFGAAQFHSAWGDRAHTLLHVGANVGCDWPTDGVLAAPDHSHMAARLAADASSLGGVAEAFDTIGVRVDTPARDRSQWFGEAADWLDAPQLLSFLGQNPWFHAPDDLPGVSCTAARTEAVADAFTEAALRLVRY
jgi:hypothetical protein